MSEIDKLYENANIKAKEYCDRDSDACMTCCPEWENRQDCWKYKSVMPPFTAEKQLELIKWLIQEVDHLELWNFGGKEETFDFDLGEINAKGATFEETLASLINNLWQSITDVELKEQIKEILE